MKSLKELEHDLDIARGRLEGKVQGFMTYPLSGEHYLAMNKAAIDYQKAYTDLAVETKRLEWIAQDAKKTKEEARNTNEGTVSTNL